MQPERETTRSVARALGPLRDVPRQRSSAKLARDDSAPARPSRAEMTATTRHARLDEARLYLVATLPATTHASSTALAGWLARVERAAAAGAGLVQLRAKHATTSARRALLAELRPRLPADVLLLVDDDLDAVFDLEGRPLADGVHLGREDAAALAPISASIPASPAAPGAAALRVVQGLAQARRRLGPELLLGTSARTLAEVSAAREAGADHVGFGAMSDSSSKLDTVRADPAELRRGFAALPGFPIFPIGGLHPGNLALVREAGGRRAALGGAIMQADDPAAVVQECLRQLAGGERGQGAGERHVSGHEA